MRWIAMVSLIGALVIHAGETASKAAFELGFAGLPIVKIKLLAKDGSSKELRMVVDTGSSITVLDRTVGAEYWKEDGKGALAQGSSGGTMEAEPVVLYQLQFGPWIMNRVQGIRLDLNEFNAVEDIPVNGILGMNVLRSGPFRLDFAAREVVWGGKPSGAYLRDLSYTRLGLPILELEVAGKRIDALCDTGSNECLDLSDQDAEKLRTATDRRSSGGQVALGGLPGIEAVIALKAKPVSAGTRSWCDPEVLFRRGTQDSKIGVRAMWPDIWFDFHKNQIGFALSQRGCIESRPAIKAPIFAYWDRRGSKAKIRVGGVKPGSSYESAGLKPGDVLLEVGAAKGDALNLATLRQALTEKGTLKVVFERRGQIRSIEVPPTK